jgi:hypothetical protein
MPRYLISFDAHAMDHIPDEDMPAVARAAHEVVSEAMNAGVWVFRRRTGKPESEHRGHRRDGHGRPVPGGDRRVLCRRRALTRGGAAVGCQERRRLPLRARSPGVHARPGRGELIERRPIRLRECLQRHPERPTRGRVRAGVVIARIRRGRVREPRGRRARHASAARSPRAYRAAASARPRPARP